MKGRPTAYKAISTRIIATALAIWLLVMAVMTWGVAIDFQRSMDQQTRECATSLYPSSGNTGRAGALERDMIHMLGFIYLHRSHDSLWPFVLPSMPTSFGSDDWIWGKWDLLYGYESAVAFYLDGEPRIWTGTWLSFSWKTEEQWHSGSEEDMGFAYMDLSQYPETAGRWIDDTPYGTLMVDYFLKVLRMTGYFEGNQFHPVKIDKLHDADIPESLKNAPSKWAAYDARVGFNWENILDIEAPAGQELVTIYGFDAEGYNHPTQECFTVEGEEFENLSQMLMDGEWHRRKENLLESVYTWVSSHDAPEGRISVRVGFRCWPLTHAVTRMIPTYLVTLALTLFMVFRFLKRIRRNLTQHLNDLAWNIEHGKPVRADAPWLEPYELETHWEQTRQALHEERTKFAQLETALQYAKSAEESRRQLVSNITHELKTPLAVIHTYAEGLQAGIAEEKRDRYIQTILEEAERMDGMVLQMLDLSRLEAGRVRLASDTFCLLDLVRDVMARLQPLAEEKNLRVEYHLAQAFSITADESRIRQVVTNLLSNAVKYTPEGGRIWIRVYSHRSGEACFYVENTAPRLSQSALEKVFEPFYRADPARREPGTGLGLAIVRTITELHRGSCQVRNTTDGVEFGITLPL